MESAARVDQFPVRIELLMDVKILLSQKMRVEAESINEKITLGDLGFDSLALSDLAEAIEERFDVQVPNRTLPDTLTAGQLADLLLNVKVNRERIHVVAEPAD
jgi:acyl carrier protein